MMSGSVQTQSFVRAVSLLAMLALGACASTYAPRTSSDGFDAQAIAWSKKAGNNTIAGSAVLETRNGATKTCAGLEVRLVPDAPYTRTRIALLYGTTDEGFVDAAEARRVQMRSDAVVDPAYKRSHKVATCDADGRFAFGNLADGSYYVLAPVVWSARGGQSTDGGFLMRRVTVAGGGSKRLLMTPQTQVSSL
jgi:hypothetical protein